MNSPDLAILREQAKLNTYTVHGNVDDADCVIGFSFGYLGVDAYEQPGKSNRQLAAFIEEHLSALPLIVQFEINDALKAAPATHVISKSRQEGEYLNSREIAEQAFILMQKHGWHNAVIVTHPAMEARNDALCSKLGMITITPPGLESIEYDPDSAQPWTRDKESWWKREQGVIQICLDNDWI